MTILIACIILLAIVEYEPTISQEDMRWLDEITDAEAALDTPREGR